MSICGAGTVCDLCRLCCELCCIAACAAIWLALSPVLRFAMLLRFDEAAVGRYGSKEPCVCECFLACPLTGESIFVLMVSGDTSLSAEELGSVRTGVIVGREKFWRLEELLFAFAFAKRERGGGGRGAFCTTGVRCLGTVKGRDSSDEEDSTRRNNGRWEVVLCDTTGEKLPGALLAVGVPVVCDMVVGGL